MKTIKMIVKRWVKIVKMITLEITYDNETQQKELLKKIITNIETTLEDNKIICVFSKESQYDYYCSDLEKDAQEQLQLKIKQRKDK